MEIVELAHKRRAFMSRVDRYTNSHRQAMKLRLLWTYDRPPNRNRDAQEVRNLYKDASKLANDNERTSELRRLITMGLKLDPRYHAFHALRGLINMRQERWTEAIKNYETARLVTKFDTKLSTGVLSSLYDEQLVEVYWKRGGWYYKQNLLAEAASDYEQIFALTCRGISVTDVQDKLLEVLRKSERYEAYRFHWNEFMVNVDARRASLLLARHAEFKIHLREIAVARHILFDALELDKDNVEAQKLLQTVYDTGHEMAVYTIIWCMHGCYEKALLTIEKGRDCDPYNPGYTLLKTIVLRLAGRLDDAMKWLENVNKDFYKLLEPSRDAKGSIMGTLSIDQTRIKLLQQWRLIQYDLAMKHVASGNHEAAYQIIRNSKLYDFYKEPYILMGNSLLSQGRPDLALRMYLCCLENNQNSYFAHSQKKIDLVQRVVDILNSQAYRALEGKRSRDAINISDEALSVFDRVGIDLRKLRIQRGQALLHKSRGHFQTSTFAPVEDCYRSMAESLRFVRGTDDKGLYKAIYGDVEMESVIDRFASKRKLPYSLKIVVEHS